jgi:hypothetical protein
MRMFAIVAFAGAVLTTAAVPASGAQIVENFTISVSGSADQEFLGTPFMSFDPSLGTLQGVAESITGSLTWFPSDPGEQLLFVAELTSASQFFPASPTGGATPINVGLNGVGIPSVFQGSGTIQEVLLSTHSLGTLSGDPLSGQITYTYTPLSTAPVPEPSTWAMMLMGFAGLGYAALRRKSARLAHETA